MANSFEDNIKRTMDNHPDFPVNEQMFVDITGRLEKEKKKNFLFAWWLPLLLLGILGTSFFAGFFYYKYKQVQDQLSKSTSIASSEKFIAIDTLYKKEQVIIYDTIYREYIIPIKRKEIDQPSNYLNSQALAGLYPLSSNITDAGIPVTSITSLLGSSFYADYSGITKPNFDFHYRGQQGISLLAAIKDDEYLASESLASYPVPKIDGIEAKELKSNVADILLYFKDNSSASFLKEEDKKSWLKRTLAVLSSLPKKSVNFLKPKYFALAVPGGRFTQLNLTRYKGNSSWGIQAEGGFNNNLSWIVGTEYLSSSFGQLFNDVDINTISGFPIISPNASADKLHEIYGRFNFFQIPLGLKYAFLKDNKIRPYLGAGVVSYLPVKSNLEYEFLSPAEYYLQRNDVLPSKFKTADFWTSIGAYYLYDNKWRFTLEGSFQKSFKSKLYIYENHQFLKWNLGAQYKF